jgi:3-isopropylmalate/(R)-2-methylmalate dehydratase small subunit
LGVSVLRLALAIPSFVLNEPRYQGASILVAGKNFRLWIVARACAVGARRVWFRAIIAPSFADIFANNCFKNGMLPIALTEAGREIMSRAQQQEGYELTSISNGRRLRIHRVVDLVRCGEFQRYCLLEGLDDIGLTLRHEDADSRV